MSGDELAAQHPGECCHEVRCGDYLGVGHDGKCCCKSLPELFEWADTWDEAPDYWGKQ